MAGETLLFFLIYFLSFSDAVLSRVQERLHRYRTTKRKSAADIPEVLISAAARFTPKTPKKRKTEAELESPSKLEAAGQLTPKKV